MIDRAYRGSVTFFWAAKKSRSRRSCDPAAPPSPWPLPLTGSAQVTKEKLPKWLRRPQTFGVKIAHVVCARDCEAIFF